MEGGGVCGRSVGMGGGMVGVGSEGVECVGGVGMGGGRMKGEEEEMLQ